jgi:hypothetical protein
MAEVISGEALVALIAAVSSAVISIISLLLSNKNNSQLEELKHKLEVKRDEQAARRDYEYDARKRLYKEFEPILFLIAEYSDNAYHRIIDLATSSRNGRLGKEGWLSKNEYFMKSTVYRLFLPLAAFKLMQRRLTLFDLQLIPAYKTQYQLARRLYLSFADDFNLAQSPPQLEYDPNTQVPAQEIERHPERYKRQGLYAGLIDNLADALIVNEKDGTSRLMSFGEFEEHYFVPQPKKPFDSAVELFFYFRPDTRPVLWRILLMQAHIYQALKRVYELRDKQQPLDSPLIIIPNDQRKEDFDWRRNVSEGTDDRVLVEDYLAIEKYLRRKLGELMMK